MSLFSGEIRVRAGRAGGVPGLRCARGRDGSQKSLFSNPADSGGLLCASQSEEVDRAGRAAGRSAAGRPPAPLSLIAT